MLAARSSSRATVVALERLAATPATGRLVLRSLSTSAPAWADKLKRTPLYDFNVKNGGKMVPFAGWDMPLSYGDVGQVAAHKHVREKAGLFDVSHMLQHEFTGAGAQDFLISLTPTSLDKLANNTSSLSVLLNDEGGIIDDTVMTKQAEDGSKWYVVTNAGRSEEDVAHLNAKIDAWNAAHPDKPVNWKILEGYGLVALQGPKAAEVLQALTGADLSALKFGGSLFAEIGKNKVRCHIARGGYTGEDGFEVSIPPEHAVGVTEEITANPDVWLIGLGARDSLRLEAGMCLYGHDLDETISPVEGGLAWLIGKDRRTPETANFPGQSRILAELGKPGPSRRRVGFVIAGSPAREGSKIFDADGKEEIGVVTSGIPSPTLGTNVAMGYVKNGHHKKNTKVQIEVRKKLREATVTPMPFVPTKYYK
ncbi:putative aminomethyltransferase, mitochondrial [Vanrija pseudolonga]|uniref:Aminomethyltransferase n=1 Tax=Vanrija pseudolonga TaxID=143232 RepID=A0AAF0Y931_9TREE|nr:putative aminomethyltransferase, mitochondrial [Vanrija pseudolonga]